CDNAHKFKCNISMFLVTMQAQLMIDTLICAITEAFKTLSDAINQQISLKLISETSHFISMMDGITSHFYLLKSECICA
ncbi:hypothetical protein ACJX0J_036129, partial [Zea mays]